MPFGISAAGALAIGAGVSAGAGIIGGVLQKGAVDKGASAARDSLSQGVTTATNQLSPWATTGQPANADQADLLGLNGQAAADAAMAKFQQSPGYAWQMQQGERAVDAGAASRGILRSGATIKAEDTFGQGLANQDFGNYWNRLQQLSGAGLTAAGGIASAATGGAANIANVDTGQAGADASIYSNMAKGVSTGANQLMSNTAFQNYIGGAGGGGASTYAGMAGADLGWI
jgi:hypothetical protein